MQRDTMIVLGQTSRVSKREAIVIVNMLRHGSVTAKGTTRETLYQ